MSGAPAVGLGRTLSVLDAAREEPSRLAVLATGVAHTYAELAGRVERRLAALASAGPLDGERPVSLVAHPTLEVLETLLALLHAGTPFLPLHPRLTPPEKESLEVRAGALRLEPEKLVSPGAASPAPPGVDDPERLAALLATSGSTGFPRLARLSHRALLSSAWASTAHLGVEEEDRLLVALPLAHVGGLMVVLRTLVARRTLVLFDPGPSLLGRLPELAAALVEHRITQLSVVPALLDRLLEPEVGLVPGSLRALLVGGAACSHRVLERAHERGLPVLTTYGLTEACAQVATRRYAERYEPPPGGSPPPVGVPLENVELRVVDGVLELRGPSLFSGYLGESGSDPRDAWFRTGDRAALTDGGEVAILGRTSDVIITGGENVDPLEVEAAVERIPGVKEACVFGIPDPTFGEVVALVYVPSGPVQGAESLLERLRTTLSRHKLPRILLATPALAKLPSGKLDRRLIAAKHRTALETMARAKQ